MVLRQLDIHMQKKKEKEPQPVPHTIYKNTVYFISQIIYFISNSSIWLYLYFYFSPTHS